MLVLADVLAVADHSIFESIYWLPVEPFIVPLAMLYPLPTYLILSPEVVSMRNAPSFAVPVISTCVMYSL